MAVFRRVEDRRAGPQAVGILVPPGQRTRVILRPRALPWDFLAVHPDDVGADRPTFRSFGRDEAALLARRLKEALELATDLVEVRANPWGEGHVAWLRCLDWLWIACPRRPGSAYQGVIFPAADQADEAGRHIAAQFRPGPDGSREVYFNTQHFHAH